MYFHRFIPSGLCARKKNIFIMVSRIHKKGKGSILPTCPKSFTLENEQFSKEIMTGPARCELLY